MEQVSESGRFDRASESVALHSYKQGQSPDNILGTSLNQESNMNSTGGQNVQPLHEPQDIMTVERSQTPTRLKSGITITKMITLEEQSDEEK